MVYFPGNEAAGFYLLFDEYLLEEEILKPCGLYSALFNKLLNEQVWRKQWRYSLDGNLSGNNAIHSTTQA